MDATLFYPSSDPLMTNGPTNGASDDDTPPPPPPPTHADLYKELRKAVNVNFVAYEGPNGNGSVTLGPASATLMALPMEPPPVPPRTMAELAGFIRDQWDQVVTEEMEEIAGGTDDTEVVAAPNVPATDDRFEHDHADYSDAHVGRQYPSYEVSSSSNPSGPSFPAFRSNYATPEYMADGDEASVYFDAEDSLSHYDTVTPNNNRLFALLSRRSRLSSPAAIPEDEKPDTTEYIPNTDRVLRSSSSFASSSTSLSSSASTSPPSQHNHPTSNASSPWPTSPIEPSSPTHPSPLPPVNLKPSSNDLVVPPFHNETVNKLTRCGMSSMYTQNMDVALPGHLPTAQAPTRPGMSYAESLPKPVFPLFFPASSSSVWAGGTTIRESPSLTMPTPKSISDFDPIPGLPYGRLAHCTAPHYASPLGLAYAHAGVHPDCSCHQAIEAHIACWDTFHYQCGLEGYVPRSVKGRRFPDFREGDMRVRVRGWVDGRVVLGR